MNFSRESIEITSVWLELVSFVFVTVELYGEERLNRATLSLSRTMESTSTRIRRRLWEPFKALYEEISKKFGGSGEAPSEPVIVAIALVLAVLFTTVFAFLLGKITSTSAFPAAFLKYVLGALLVAGLFFYCLYSNGLRITGAVDVTSRIDVVRLVFTCPHEASRYPARHWCGSVFHFTRDALVVSVVSATRDLHIATLLNYSTSYGLKLIAYA
jgi:hypothetical protein